MLLQRKPYFWILLLIFVLFGCSKEPADHGGNRSIKSSAPIAVTLPFTVQIVETPALLENRKITDKAQELFEAKKYEELEQFANEYRKSKECRPDGIWELVQVYGGMWIPAKSSDEKWEQHLNALQEWVRARPKSITARVSLADNWISYAWKARSSRVADLVTEQQWKDFGIRLNEASKALSAAGKLEERCPVYWSMVLRAAVGLDTDKQAYDSMFQKALKAYPDYTYYYGRRAWFLLPRWHGDEGEWEADLKKSADRIGGDDGDLLYARVVYWTQGYHENVFKENHLSWERVEKGLGVMEERYPDSLEVKNLRAYLSALGSDRTAARKCFDQLNGQVVLSVWGNEETFRKMANDVYAR
jgi:hypothetical protein